MRITGILAAIVLAAALSWSGCGTVEETTDSTGTWTEPTPATEPTPPQTAVLEYRIDSLISENRRLKQQVDAMAAETRSLTARNAEMETRLNEALTAPHTPPPQPDMTGTYSTALGEYRRRNFAGAAAQFKALMNSGIQEDLADNCHYWIGESMYGMGKYPEAIDQFQRVLDYAHSEKKDDAQMMLGNCYIALRDVASARAALSALVSKYPTSPYVKRAQEKLATLK
jgi:TolA-binding protein